MKYLKPFNIFEKVSYFDREGVKNLLPKELEIITTNGEFKLVFNGITINDSLIQFDYYQNVWGEPDVIQFNLYLTKVNDGDVSNSDTLKLDVDITYGDAMVSEFTITPPNNVSVEHYTGKGSMYDPETFFGFTDESLNKIIKFFNKFGYSLKVDQFLFIDKKNDDYSKKIKK